MYMAELAFNHFPLLAVTVSFLTSKDQYINVFDLSVC